MVTAGVEGRKFEGLGRELRGRCDLMSRVEFWCDGLAYLRKKGMEWFSGKTGSVV